MAQINSVPLITAADLQDPKKLQEVIAMSPQAFNSVMKYGGVEQLADEANRILAVANRKISEYNTDVANAFADGFTRENAQAQLQQIMDRKQIQAYVNLAPDFLKADVLKDFGGKLPTLQTYQQQGSSVKPDAAFTPTQQSSNNTVSGGTGTVNMATAGQTGQQGTQTQAGGTIPGYKGIYKGQTGNATNDQINNLFQQYHGRAANADELKYWSNKDVSKVEDTLAKTEIFGKDAADKIRAQMQSQGMDYIANQQQLQTLAQAGGLNASQIQQVSGQTGMMFQPSTTGGTTTGGTTTGGTTGGTTDGTSNLNSGSQSGWENNLVQTVANAVGNPNASTNDIMQAFLAQKQNITDPYYQQLYNNYANQVVTQVNNTYEDRIRQLQTESYNMSENIRGTQKALEGSGLTFSGEAIRQLGTLSSFAAQTDQALTPAQLGQQGAQTLAQQTQPKMSADQMGIEGVVNQQNRLMAEGSRAQFNRSLQDIGSQAQQYLGTQGLTGLGLPAQATGNLPQWSYGTLPTQYFSQLQSDYSNLQGHNQALTNYQQNFVTAPDTTAQGSQFTTPTTQPTPQQTTSNPITNTATKNSSTPPAGATYISNPSQLVGLKESQLWRDPNSTKIYKLA